MENGSRSKEGSSYLQATKSPVTVIVTSTTATSTSTSANSLETSPVFFVPTSGTEVSPKEVILVSLAFLLLAFSVSLFFKHWKKNYWDINQLPYYAHCYEDNPLATPAPHLSRTSASPRGGTPLPMEHSSSLRQKHHQQGGSNVDTTSLFEVACNLSRSHSARYTTRPSSFHRSALARRATARVHRPRHTSEGHEHHRRTLSATQNFSSDSQSNFPSPKMEQEVFLEHLELQEEELKVVVE